MRIEANRRLLILGFVLMFCGPLVGRSQQIGSDSLSNEDKTELVESALHLTFGNQPDFGIVRKLSSENIDFIEPSRISRLGFVLLDASHMRNVKKSQFAEYVVFRRILSRDAVVIVALSRITVGNPCFGRAFFRERSITYEFHKQSGQWIGQLATRPTLGLSYGGTLFRNP
jgi:hypothetical protein